MSIERPDLVERRQRYIDRQRELDRDAVNVDVRGRAPRGSGPLNRDGMPKLPVGQHVVPNWPVLDLGDMPDVNGYASRFMRFCPDLQGEGLTTRSLAKDLKRTREVYCWWD